MVVRCSEKDDQFLVDSGRAGIANIRITHLPALDSENCHIIVLDRVAPGRAE
jgi:hypothetical protein